MSGLWLSIEGLDSHPSVLAFPQAGRLLIGREAACQVVLEHPNVSRRHALLERVGDEARLTDLSANGTRVGQTLVRRTTVPIAQEPIKIGKFVLHVHMEDPAALSPPEPPQPRSGTEDVPVAIRRQIHRRLLEQLDLVKIERNRMNDHLLRAKVRIALQEITTQISESLPVGTAVEKLIEELTNEALGLGPLEELLAEDAVTEIMVVDPRTIYVERKGRIEHTSVHFTDDDALRAVIERILMPLGRRIDESSPLVDARLPDGSRVNAIIPPLALRGPCITIRKFAKQRLLIENLMEFGSLDAAMARFLERTVRARKNVLISGGTGSGKTTLLNVLSSVIHSSERIVTIEDAAELRLAQPHVVSLEAKPSNMEGRGEVTIRDLVKNAMRMRPDRIIVGEVRSGEALDMLQAMNTGHDGAMTTTHANSPDEALKRVETLALMAGLDLPARAIREQIARAIHVVVQQARLSDGSRKLTGISEVVGLQDDGSIATRELFVFRRTGTGPKGEVLGDFRATGNLPSFLGELITLGLIAPGEAFL